MIRRNMQLSALLPALCLWAALAGCAQAEPSVVHVVKHGDGYQLTRNGQPYFIKGAGGDGSKQLLRDVGGNSFRTWGAEGSQAKLDEAQKYGLTMTLGIWLGHKEHGFNYHDAAAVARQFEDAKKAIDTYKDHPALLMWGIGNEMESGLDNEPAVWQAVEQIAAYAKKVDPNHPTMTVVAEIGGNKVQLINQYCPSIDVIGINSYGGGPSLADRYKKAGGVKPYVITEFGPPGTWEVGKNEWGAAPELTSTQKAARYRETYEKAVANQPLCLGSYAFTWGNKQEATSTWFGLLLPDGSKLSAVDALSKLWGGTVTDHAPEIESLKVVGAPKVAPDATVHVALNATDPDNDPLKVDWVLQHDPLHNNTGGATEAAPPTYPDAIVKADAHGADLKMPKYGGGYRVFAFIHDGKGSAAVANVPLFVDGGGTPPPAAARRAQLPLALYAEAGDAPYIPSGYMGNTAAIHMDPNDATNPHSGKTDLKVEYTANDNWGGVVWQSPANDWGNADGGYNLTGASKLTFWARGAKGGEKVTFLFGLIDRDKPFYDTAQGKLADVILTPEWKPYTIDLAGKDLSRIKTGFAWTVAGNGAPITFFLDDINYEPGAGGATAPVAAQPAPLPLVVYDEPGHATFVPSGYMGNTAAIKMAEDATDNPHTGGHALRVDYTANDNWGGVVWQSPANDWGTAPGGYNLTGATKLTFWARGAKGGEKVSFQFGLLGRDKPFFDTAQGKLADVILTPEWKQYTIDLAGKDLTRIKTGFVWTVAANGAPITFYLDDVKYE